MVISSGLGITTLTLSVSFGNLQPLARQIYKLLWSAWSMSLTTWYVRQASGEAATLHASVA